MTLWKGSREVQLILNLTRKLPNPPWGFRVAWTAIVLTTGVSALRLAFNMGYYYHLFRCAPSLRLGCFLSMEGSYILGVTFALVLSAIGLWSRRLLGFLLSLIALAWLAEIYREWYVATLSIMQMGGVRDFSQLQDQQQYLLPLNGATWWDIVVLGVALIVFIWQAVMLKRILKPRAVVPESQPTAELG